MRRIAVLLSLFSFASLSAFAVEHEIAVEPTPSPTPDKSQYNLFNPTPIDLRRPYNTDRPSKTDSAYTIDAGVFQIETDVVNWTLDEDRQVRTRTWLIGQTNFKVGLTNWMDLQIFPQFYVNTRTSGSGFGPALERDGFGDTTVRLKVNFIGNDGGDFVVGFLASMKVPTNTNHLGNGVWEPAFEIPACRILPGGITLFGMTRIDILDEPHSSSKRVQWSNPIGVSRTIVGNLSGYIEFYDAVSTGHDHPWVGTLDTGLIYQVTKDFSIDVNSFLGVTNSAPDYNVFVGFGRRF